jgi:hypothetical protein
MSFVVGYPIPKTAIPYCKQNTVPSFVVCYITYTHATLEIVLLWAPEITNSNDFSV